MVCVCASLIKVTFDEERVKKRGIQKRVCQRREREDRHMASKRTKMRNDSLLNATRRVP